MNEEQFKKELSEAYNNIHAETRNTVFMVMSYEAVEYFNKMLLKLYEEYKEQEEIKNKYYKLLDNV